MHDPLDALLFYDDLLPEQQEALRAALDDDPALAEAFTSWRQARAALRGSLDEHLPDRRLLVLYALEASGRAGVLSDQERADLAAARPALERALQAHPALTTVVGQIDGACADFDAAWKTHVEGDTRPARAADRKTARPRRQRTALRWGWRAAAMVAVAAFVTVLVLVGQRDGSRVTVQVAEGQTRLIELADGSTVRLLGGSSLTYTDPSKARAFNRRVELDGRAFFDIAPDQQGFTVETPTALATVLGTSFGIRTDDGAMEVVLATGSLSVASKAARDRIVVLEPGQMSRVAFNALPSTPAEVDLSEALDWTGLFLFRATPLEEVAARLSERFGVAIGVSPALASEAVTGTFAREHPLEQILGVLATTLDATVAGNAADGYQIVPSEPEP